MKYAILFFTSFVFLLMSCGEEFDYSVLHGEWQAHQFIESGKDKQIDVSKMGFTFNDKMVYTFHNNVKTQEAGNYHVERSILYSTDTLNNSRIEKAVKITRITNDTLHISMNSGGVEQEIILHKVK